MRQTIDYDLHSLLAELVKSESGIVELYLFGSRAYGTGSLRSDCDVLVRADPRAQVKASSLRDFALERCPALDLFLCTDVRAVSVANDSFVYAATFEDLVYKLDAVKLWSLDSGFQDFGFPTSSNWVFQTASQVDFIPTSLPDGPVADLAWQLKIKGTSNNGVESRPVRISSLPS